MFIYDLNFFYKTGLYIGGLKTLDVEVNKFNLVFFLYKRKSFLIVNYEKFIYIMRIFLFFLYKLISLRGKILAYDDRFYIRRCLIFFLSRANQNYIIKHWIGGTLTNFRNFQSFFFQIAKGLLSIKKYYDLFIYYYGLKSMQQIPSLVVFTNAKDKNISFQEVFRLAIPSASLVDIITKNVFGITFPIPSNSINLKSLIIFYSLLGDSLLYGFLKPVSYFFNLFLKRLKKSRQSFFFNDLLYSKIYNNVINLFFKKLIKNTKMLDVFLKNKFFFFCKKKKIFNLKFFLNKRLKKIFSKKFFKNSFIFLFSLKKILKMKKRRRRKFKKIFKYRKRLKKRKFFKIFKIIKKKFLKIFRKNFRYIFKKLYKRKLRLNFIIFYNKYKNYYRKNMFTKISKIIQYEEKHIEAILEEFDELPQERKEKQLKKFYKNFEKLKIFYLEKNDKVKNLVENKKFFIIKYNKFKYMNIDKVKNKFFILLKKITKSKKEKKTEIVLYDINFYKNMSLYLNYYQNLYLYFKIKKNYINLLKQRREESFYFNTKIILLTTKGIRNSLVNTLYYKIQND
jgi:ribosomal protein S2